MPDKHFLMQMKALPLHAKVVMTQQRIREWYNHWDGDVYVSFSGGKDSTVLATLVRDMYPDVPLVFCNTGLEYPEIQAFARKMGAEFIRPKMTFSEVISTYGYPIISKENAEAIYVARRIRNGGGTAKKEKDERNTGLTAREKNLSDSRNAVISTTPKFPWGGYNESGNLPQESGHDEQKACVQHGARAKREDKMWVNWRRQAIAGVGAFSADKGSIYNKVKWLPLCRDTQFMISHMCCNVMKKGPMHTYQRKTKLYPILGTLTEESRLREQAWIRHGCNAFDATVKTSQPMSFWTEQDVLHYVWEEGLEIASVYGDIVAVDKNGFEYEPPFFASQCNMKCSGCQRTGCVYCLFGAHLNKDDRLVNLAKTHPKQYEYCMKGGQWVDNPKYDPVAPKMDGEWQNWNPKKIWVPSKEGLGMKKVIDDVNAIYGKDFIRYE